MIGTYTKTRGANKPDKSSPKEHKAQIQESKTEVENPVRTSYIS